jgi:hypothetical protein
MVFSKRRSPNSLVARIVNYNEVLLTTIRISSLNYRLNCFPPILICFVYKPFRSLHLEFCMLGTPVEKEVFLLNKSTTKGFQR